MDAKDVLRQCIAELHEATEVAMRRAAFLRDDPNVHHSLSDHADGVAEGMQRALDHISKRVLKEIGVL